MRGGWWFTIETPHGVRGILTRCAVVKYATYRSVGRSIKTNMTAQDRSAVQNEGRASEVYRTAAEMILQNGYDATSVSDIAAALGITKAGLYHYIHGKTQLLFDIMQYGLDQLDREVAQPAMQIRDAETRLRFMIAMHARIVTRGHGAVTILVDEARALSPAQNRKITRRKRDYVDFLRATLGEMKAQRKLRDVDATV